MPTEKPRVVLIGAGGTGGHLIPAQTLGTALIAKGIKVFFAAKGLETNPLFDRATFSFQEIASASPFVEGKFSALLKLGKGVFEALRLLGAVRPDLVIGFGSFYSFPLLCAAQLRKIPYLLVDANAIPGKVNRVMGKRALKTLVQFEEAKKGARGKVELAEMPLRRSAHPLTKEEARAYYGLEKEKTTLLILGGSQGAKSINLAASRLTLPLQIIHLAGKEEDVAYLRSCYQKAGIVASVHSFEPQMERALIASDLALCRGGGGTLAELVEHTLPALIVPWEGAMENHQMANGLAMSGWGGAKVLREKELGKLPETLLQILSELEEMKGSQQRRKELLSSKTVEGSVLFAISTRICDTEANS